jgi:hypothetical protein
VDFSRSLVLVLIGCFAFSAAMKMESVRRNVCDLHDVSEDSGHHCEKI